MATRRRGQEKYEDEELAKEAAAKVKPEDTAWAELVDELDLQTDDSSELKTELAKKDEETKKLLADKDEEHKQTKKQLNEKDEEAEALRQQHKTEIAKKDVENQEMRAELERLKARLATAEEGVPPPNDGK
eukprot:COSAG04_NODE_1106_length_8232_cov_4.848641_2_plen_131_part_00